MKIPNKFMGLLGKFADSLDYKDLPKGWADNPEIVQAAEELYRGMGTESPFFKAWARNGDRHSVENADGFFVKVKEPVRKFSDGFYDKWHGAGEKLKKDFPEKSIEEIFSDPAFLSKSNINEDLFNLSTPGRIRAQSLISSGFNGNVPKYHVSVRHGDLPENEISKNHAENFLEKGLSVVDFLPDLIDGKGQIKKTYYDMSFGKDAPKNIVGGWHTGNYGSDGEPLILLPQVIGETKGIGNIAKSEKNIGTFNPKSKNVYKALPLAAGGAAAGAAMMPEEAQAASFTGFKNLGENVLGYMMKHRPIPDEEMSAGLHDLGEVFPGIYGKRAGSYSTYNGKDVDAEAMAAINAVKDNPEAMVDIFRAVPKGVRDFNTGDWVTTSKSYARKHGNEALGGDFDIIKTKARAADISNPGDSIAEEGYWGEPVLGKITKGILPIMAAGGTAAALAPSSAQAAIPADAYPWPAKQKGYVNREPGLEAPVVDPVDIMTAPIGAATAGGKVAAMAAEPFLAYGMDKAGNWLGNRLGGLLGYFGWGE